MEFKELKQIALDNARKADACPQQFSRLLRVENEIELLQVFADNAYWVISNKVTDAQFIEDNFSNDAKIAVGIYTSGDHTLEVSEDKNIVLLGSSQATIKTWGSSQATYELKDCNGVIRNLNKKKIFVKKSKFEIVEI
jgi:hypothetical protein